MLAVGRGFTRLSQGWMMRLIRSQLASLTLQSPRGSLLATPPVQLAKVQRGFSSIRAYNNPEVYDIAFNFRNFEQEAAFLLEMYQQYCSGPLKHTLELGCGPARHSILLAQSAGCTGVALDLSQPMLDYAAQKAEAAGVADKLTFAQADITTSFADGLLPGATSGGALVDLALISFGTLAHCLTTEAAIICFSQVAKLLRPGGLLVLEVGMPEELFDGTFYDPDRFVDAWDATDGNKMVLVEWGRDGDEFDPATQVFHRTVGMTLYKDDEIVSSEVQQVQQRQFTLQEIKLLGRYCRLDIAGVYGDFKKEVPLDDDEAYHLIVCLTHSGSGT